MYPRSAIRALFQGFGIIKKFASRANCRKIIKGFLFDLKGPSQGIREIYLSPNIKKAMNP